MQTHRFIGFILIVILFAWLIPTVLLSRADMFAVTSSAWAGPAGTGPQLMANWGPAAPAIDGTIGTSEWAYARSIDISLGSTSVILRVLNNSTYLFLALDDQPNTTVGTNNNDQVVLYFDDEGGALPLLYDNLWTNTVCDDLPNKGEGSFTVGAFGSNAADRYQAYITGATVCTLQLGGTNVLYARGGSSGHVQHEIAIPLDGRAALVASPGHTFGLQVSTRDGDTGNYTGTWPDPSTANQPATYGNLTLATQQSTFTWRREAEDGSVAAPMQVGNDDTASACRYVFSPVGWQNGGWVDYSVTVPATGNYYPWARAMGLGHTANSFFVRVDGGDELHFEIPQVGGQWIWGWSRVHQLNQLPEPFLLSAGTHSLRVGARESYSRLDALLITNSPVYEPPVAVICTTATPMSTPTSVPTAPPTATFTSTPTATPTFTATPTPTPTVTPTATPVPTRGLFMPWVGRQPTATPTATATPTPTATSTPTPTATPTPICPNDPTEPNGTFGEAWGPLPANQVFLGFFNCTADTLRDYYYFDIGLRRAVVVTLQGIPPGSDYDLTLYNCPNSACLIAHSGNTGNANERIELTTNAGRYYVRVIRSPSSPLVVTPYQLRVQLP